MNSKERERYGIVISAFPGCGKTYFVNKLNENLEGSGKIFKGINATDSDSSSYSWVMDHGIKRRNPDFPKNYIEHIKEARKNYDLVFVSTHQVVRDAMDAAGIPFELVYPNPQRKAEWVGNYYLRGNTKEFIDTIVAHWDEWIGDMAIPKEGEVPHIRHMLDNGMYLKHLITTMILDLRVRREGATSWNN